MVTAAGAAATATAAASAPQGDAVRTPHEACGGDPVALLTVTVPVALSLPFPAGDGGGAVQIGPAPFLLPVPGVEGGHAVFTGRGVGARRVIALAIVAASATTGCHGVVRTGSLPRGVPRGLAGTPPATRPVFLASGQLRPPKVGTPRGGGRRLVTGVAVGGFPPRTTTTTTAALLGGELGFPSVRSDGGGSAGGSLSRSRPARARPQTAGAGVSPSRCPVVV